MGKWKDVCLGEVFPYIRNGASIKQEDNATGYPITRIETIADGSIDRNRMGYANIDSIEQYSDFVLETGDILMSHINSVKHLGKTALYVQQDDESIIHGMNLLNLRADSDVLSSVFAHRFFNSYYFKKQLPNITKDSVNQSSFNITALKKLLIPLPPLPVQQQIADVLDHASALIEKRKAQIDKLDLLVKSQFIKMFGDPVANPKGFPTKCFIDVVKLQRGHDLPVQNRDLSGNIPVYGSNGILGFHSESKTKNGIITGRSGTIGIVNHCKGDFWPLNTTLYSVETHGNNIVYLKYLLGYFSLERFYDGTGVPTLNRNVVHKTKLIDVPLESQTVFANFVHKVEAQKSFLRQSLAKLEQNYKSLMQKCFRGERYSNTIMNKRMDYYGT
ncbi:MAG: restriction endonuclease subunit S [Clostridia bacterium]|nr:restriction endonuclease subunit S [Clostridia bacterium]